MKTLKSSLKFSVVEITPKDAEVIINDKGLTDNGYHRLAACIQAGVPFQTVLIEGVKHET